MFLKLCANIARSGEQTLKRGEKSLFLNKSLAGNEKITTFALAIGK
jgi:hypothetical protein